MVRGAEEFPGRPAAFGVMALRGTRLERGASLARVTVEAARSDPAANIRAAAALLDAHATETGIDRSRPEAWEPVAAWFAGIDVPAARAAYVRQVARVQGLGAAAAQAALTQPCPPADTATGRDYATAIWRASPNFNARPAATGGTHMVIIHTCEGNYTGCWGWLVNPVSRVSAHYVVNEEGTQISQLVLERDRAWHIAALYDCTLNRSHDCSLDGVQSNDFTVGIEHAGFHSQASFPASQIEASAALLCNVTRDRGIPRDWQHVVAHSQLQANKSDPGPNWPWIAYLHRAQALCGETVVDDSARYNDAAVAAADVPAGWGAAQTTADYYGGGYRWASTAPDATDGATFSFRVDAAGPRTVDVRWTSGTNRSARAAYVVVTEAGATLDTQRVDQRSGGGAWRTLGSWSFPAGWHRVVLLRRDTAGAVVVADAVRIRR
jgi:N-acetyl-anhydromuramyl-L-alanine amidase AmpD